LALELGYYEQLFVFEPVSARYVESDQFFSFIQNLEPYAVTVGVYGKQSRRIDPCAFVQYVHRRLVDPVRSLTDSDPLALQADCRVAFQAIRLPLGLDLQSAIGQISDEIANSAWQPRAVVLDGFDEEHFGGSGVRADWHLAADLVKSLTYPVILAGGLTPDNVAEAIQKVRPYAVDVSSGVEVEGKPGIKDPIKLRDFIQAAKQA
jgi:phosphoribosylanthranilate isomerase